MPNRTVRFFAFTAWLSMAGSAAPLASLAADVHEHEHKQHAAHHGGVVATAKHTEFELVAKSEVITTHVSEDEKPVSTKGARAGITLDDGAVIKLLPAGENRLEAKGAFKTAPGTRLVASVALAGKETDKLQFTLK
jgi:hypothetical protein